MGGGVAVRAEQTRLIADNPGLCPDILVINPGNQPVVIETEFEPARTVEKEARDRLGKELAENAAIIEQALTLRLPSHLRKSLDLEKALHEAVFEICVYSKEGEQNNRWPKEGWVEVNVDTLATAIEITGLSEKHLLAGMKTLEKGVKKAASILERHGKEAPNMLEDIAKTLRQVEAEQTWRMAMAIIVNALGFHRALEGARGFKPLSQFREDGHVNPDSLADAWEYVYKNVNYFPIFQIATVLLKAMKNSTARQILDELIAVANALDKLGTTKQNSLNGRMFQRLIADRKFLATYYTLPNSATFLAELAVARLDLENLDAETVKGLRVADFACGTGALLGAAYNAIMSRGRRKMLDDEGLHSHMMEKVLSGTDIMPAASHLTVSMLASFHPREVFQKTRVATLPYGDQGPDIPVKIGALDLIDEIAAAPIFDQGNSPLPGIGKDQVESIDFPHGSFGLVAMNPPFTRPTSSAGKNQGVSIPSFAAFETTEEERVKMSQRLDEITQAGMAGHGNAGLASNFIDLAHAKIKRGGVVALILPETFVKGASWKKARQLLKKHYKNITIVSVTANEAADSTFSADTGMADTLVIATRKIKNEGSEKTIFISLVRRPQHALEAFMAARAISTASYNSQSGKIRLGNNITIGRYSIGTLGEGGSAVEADVEAAAAGLYQGFLCLPRMHQLKLPMAKLGELGTRGPYHLDIRGKTQSGGFRGPFDVVGIEGTPAYPMLWKHDSTRETRLVVKPDRMGEIREGCERDAIELWRKHTSLLHFNQEFSMGSQPLAACLTPEPVLGGRAWPSFSCTESCWDIPLVLWSNTSLGLISFWWTSTHQQPGRPMLSISRLPSLAVLDPRILSPKQLSKSQSIFDEFKDKDFLPAYKACIDQTRKDLDKAVLIKLLGQSEDILEHLDKLRQQWCAEPSVHGSYKPANPQI